MTGLVRYEAARAALQAAHDVDEVKDIRDKAQAMAAYAKQAKDTKMVEWASEIKVRAERRAGAMLAEMKINGSRHDGKNAKNLREYPEVTPERSIDSVEDFSPTLETLGVSKKQSAQWQKVAAIPEEKFEKAITRTKEAAGMVTTSAVLRSAVAPSAPAKKPASKPKKDAKPDASAAEIKKLKDILAERDEKIDDLAETARALEDKLTAFEKTEPDEQQKEIMKLQKRIVRLEAEIERLTRARNDAQAKNNELIREVKRLRKRG